MCNLVVEATLHRGGQAVLGQLYFRLAFPLSKWSVNVSQPLCQLSLQEKLLLLILFLKLLAQLSLSEGVIPKELHLSRFLFLSQPLHENFAWDTFLRHCSVFLFGVMGVVLAFWMTIGRSSADTPKIHSSIQIAGTPMDFGGCTRHNYLAAGQALLYNSLFPGKAQSHIWAGGSHQRGGCDTLVTENRTVASRRCRRGAALIDSADLSSFPLAMRP